MVTENQAGTEPVQNQDTEPTEATFTQAELDAKIEERLARERKKFPSKDEMTAFKTWKASQTPPEPTAPPEPVVDNTALIQAKSELELYKLNAQPEFMEFLIAKLSAMDGDDIKANAVAVKEKNPQYFQPVQTKRVATAPRMGGGSKPPATTNEKMNNLLRGI